MHKPKNRPKVLADPAEKLPESVVSADLDEPQAPPAPAEVFEEPSMPREAVTPPRPRRKPGTLIAIVLAVALFAYFGIVPRLSQSQTLKAQTKQLDGGAPSVSVVRVTRGEDASQLTLPSNIQAIEQTTINARTSGYVRARYVDIGSRVTAGQVLAEIESPEMDQQVAESEAEVAKAQAGVGQAQAEVSRQEASVAGARSEYVRYQASVGQSKADLAHLKAKYSQALSAVDVARAKLIQADKQRDSVKAALARAKVGEDIANKTLKRWKELEKADAVSGQDVDEKQSDYDSSVARVSQAQADVSSADADVQAAQDTIKSLQAEVAAARADIDSGNQKIQAARAALSSSQATIDAAIAAGRASKSNVDAARAAVGSNEASVRRYSAMQGFEKVVAPFAGVITARNVDVGDLVNATSGGSGASDQTSTVTRTGLFGLARTNVLMAQVNVPEENASGIHDGQHAVIQTLENPGKSFDGQVFHVSGALDAASRTLLVEVSIPNDSGALKPGMYAQIRFIGSTGPGIIRVPADTVVFNAKGDRVAIVEPDNTLRFVQVRLGRDFGSEVEILEGLKGGERLVTNPDDSLQDGMKVAPVEASK